MMDENLPERWNCLGEVRRCLAEKRDSLPAGMVLRDDWQQVEALLLEQLNAPPALMQEQQAALPAFEPVQGLPASGQTPPGVVLILVQ